jgi:hypothetical protein
MCLLRHIDLSNIHGPQRVINRFLNDKEARQRLITSTQAPSSPPQRLAGTTEDVDGGILRVPQPLQG